MQEKLHAKVQEISDHNMAKELAEKEERPPIVVAEIQQQVKVADATF